MNTHPTIHELRERVFKHSGTGRPEVGNWLARRVGRPSAIYGTWVVSRTKISANAITSAALLANFAGAAAIGTGQRAGFVAGTCLLMIGYWLDHVDGQIARWKGTATLSGVFFDYLLHHFSSMTLGFGLGFGLAIRTGEIWWTVAGFAVALGWTGLNLSNDCRYKALFTELKRSRRTLRVYVNEQDRPAPPPSWPSSWPGILSWPLAKACESHVVLVALAGLSVFAIFRPGFWLLLWKCSILLIAILAPTLAIARAGKSILRRETDREFDRMFRPME